MSEEQNQQIANQLQTILDKNGFSFQYSLLEKFRLMRKANETNWLFEGAEIPVSVSGVVSHIDFVLRYKKTNIYLIGECKRTDPAKSHWCFVSAPFTWRGQATGAVQFDSISNASHKALTAVLYSAENIKSLGFELKTGQQGDGVGSNEKSPINSAVSQVLRNSSGFINHTFREDRKLKVADEPYYFIPAIFTTAKIFTSETEIDVADLKTGYLPKDSVKIEPRDWIWFNHNRSTTLSHDILLDDKLVKEQNLSYFFEFTRSVAIISPTGIDDFMKSVFPDSFG